MVRPTHDRAYGDTLLPPDDFQPRNLPEPSQLADLTKLARTLGTVAQFV